MSMPAEDLKRLQRYQALKPQVQEILEIMKSDDRFAALVASSTQLARAIEVLGDSIRLRRLVGSSLGHDEGHAARIQQEASALNTLSEAAKKRNEEEAQKQAAWARQQAAEARKAADLRDSLNNNDGFPSLAEAAQVRGRRNAAPPPQVPKPFVWGQQGKWK